MILDLIKAERMRLADQLEAKVRILRAMNKDAAESRRFKKGPFNTEPDRQRSIRIEVLLDIIEALRA